MKTILFLSHLLYLGSVKGKTVCTDELPCYERTLTYIADGILEFDEDTAEEDFLGIYAKAGFSRDEVIAWGRKAVTFYLEQYGIDFTHLDDTALLSGTSDGPNGLSFRPIFTRPDLKYRLYTASVSGRYFSKSQHYNSPVYDAGWFIFVTENTQASGTYTGTIPSDALLVFGHYIIRPCDVPDPSCTWPWKCHDILGVDSAGAIVIQYNTEAYFIENTNSPVVYGVIDCAVYHPVWGEGRARGVSFSRGGTGRDIRNVLTFPPLK